jgi:hypothetical protein
MSSLTRALLTAAFASLAYGHSQILNAQGDPNSPASVGFLGMMTITTTTTSHIKRKLC